MKQIIYKNTVISYSDIGTGTTVVLLHGFLENKTMWKDLAPILAKKNRVISIDLLGHGQSECLGYVHSMEENAEIIKAIVSFVIKTNGSISLFLLSIPILFKHSL